MRTTIQSLPVLLIGHRVVIVIVEIYTASRIVVVFEIRVIPLQPIVYHSDSHIVTSHTKLPHSSHIEVDMVQIGCTVMVCVASYLTCMLKQQTKTRLIGGGGG